MRKWERTCEFTEIRELIESDNDKSIQIKEKLIEICKKYADEDWDFADDFSRLAEDIEDIALDDYDTEENIDWALGEFYDLCDNASVWLEV